ncbi:c-type cytochrome [Blastopirellula marina]|uniref:Putative cytochrome c n=1 Tax=Blastopirellula marina DSM 3645 TaxID=314230 RepID=A4A2J9_9BACT|nr:c-type cytochrome [Blastopirellula marina]EAQ77019.1 putative cytochrome c [Blastopirellula marina DSM 3645]
MPTANLYAIVAAILLLASMSIGCGKPDPAERFVRPDDITDFHVLFQQNCIGCHGATGDLGPAPPLADPLFQAIVSDDQLRETIADGRPGTLMPAFEKDQGGSLTTDQVQILVAGIRETWKAASTPTDKLPPYQVSTADPAGLKDANVMTGKELFETSCAKCHGDAGVGGDAGALNEPALARLMSDIVLRRLIITGRPDLKMPDYVTLGKKSHTGEAFTSEQISDIAAYVRSLQQPTKIAALPADENQ